jgi:uncharacterized protein YndB with AHSA1/START domain/DNA-binding transcriptional ArsR family regulator
MDAVFKALADRHRRRLLDRLFKRDGQTLAELCTRVAMTRFGVMKHLAVLEEARLITTRRDGRNKLHYLNPMPIRLIHDRWVGKYAAPFAAFMSQLKSHLEGPMSNEQNPKQVYELYIRTTPQKLWQALTDGKVTQQYFFGSTISAKAWKKGERYESRGPDGTLWVDGDILEAEPPRRLVQTWKVHYDPQLKDEPVTRVSWEIEPRGAVCKLTATHYLEGAALTAKHVSGGWQIILSSLKTLLETGEPLVIDPI